MSPLFKKILSKTQERLAERKRALPEAELRSRLAEAPPVRSFKDALSREFSVIAEHKRRSPSGGDMDPHNLAQALSVYQKQPWISAISVLTDEDHFKGSLADLQKARELFPDRPLLRKDFLIDPYQVLEARLYGADAVLLMATLHADQPGKLHELLDLTHELGMHALLEIGMGGEDAHKLQKIVPPHAEIWGINARTFEGSLGVRAAVSRLAMNIVQKDLMTSRKLHDELRDLIPPGKIAVAESGIHTADHLRTARAGGYQAALIGTAFLKGPRRIEEVAAEFSQVFSD